jgi:hypothetical protein
VARPPTTTALSSSFGCHPSPQAEDPLLFVAFTSFFRDFSPEIACQAPNPSNPIKINDIQVAF